MGQGRSLLEGFNQNSEDDPEAVMQINQTEKVMWWDPDEEFSELEAPTESDTMGKHWKQWTVA